MATPSHAAHRRRAMVTTQARAATGGRNNGSVKSTIFSVMQQMLKLIYISSKSCVPPARPLEPSSSCRKECRLPRSKRWLLMTQPSRLLKRGRLCLAGSGRRRWSTSLRSVEQSIDHACMHVPKSRRLARSTACARPVTCSTAWPLPTCVLPHVAPPLPTYIMSHVAPPLPTCVLSPVASPLLHKLAPHLLLLCCLFDPPKRERRAVSATW